MKRCKFCHNTVILAFVFVALHQRHTNYLPEGCCGESGPLDIFLLHTTPLFSCQHTGDTSLSLILPLSDALSIHRFGRGGVTLSPGGVNSWRITFSTPISHVHTHFQHTHSGTYICCLLSWDESFSRLMNLTTCIYALKWFLNVLRLFQFSFTIAYA